MRIFILLLLIWVVLMFGLMPYRQSDEPVKTLDLNNWINSADGSYKKPLKQPLSFPKDHGQHKDVQSESWRFSGMLRDDEGKQYGFQVAFFRLNMGNNLSQRQSAWATRNIYRAQMAYTPEYANNITFNQRTSRDALELAGYQPDQQKLWLHDWQLKISKNATGNNSFILQLADNTDKLNLTLQALKPAIEMSLSEQIKFYGISRLQADGTLQIGGQSKKVSGVAFFDHAWGNLPMGGGQLVWNRFILQLSNNQELVILQSRRRDGSGTPINSGFLIGRNSEVVELSRKQFTMKALEYWQSQKSSIRYPLSWEIVIPDKKLTLNIYPLIKDQEIADALVDWSGTVKITGKSAGTELQGTGLMQLNGYGSAP